ncbi:DUF4286 family protein [Sphingobacterium sp. Mn56C]|uniref:DUF4286 family protein n=1 Tax=Sphingobacterium sp. Mn56C TaxID=3395261 RepID=UPI003BC9C0DF
MFLYNISIIVEEGQHSTLKNWLQNEWIPSLPQETKFLKMLNSPHEGHTYCIQMLLSDIAEISDIQNNNLHEVQAHITQNYPEKAFIFDSVMEYLLD